MRVIATIAAGLLLAGCSSPSQQQEPASQASTAPTTPATFAVSGTYTVPLDGLDFTAGQACGEVTSYRWPDITKGAQVTVRSSTAEVLAVGELADGTYRANPEWQNLHGFCVFPFEVPDVPDGHAIYTVEIAQRGPSAYPRTTLDKPVGIALTVG